MTKSFNDQRAKLIHDHEDAMKALKAKNEQEYNELVKEKDEKYDKDLKAQKDYYISIVITNSLLYYKLD